MQQKENLVRVRVQQRYVGLIIGAGGSTLQKIRTETGAGIVMNQETKLQGYSVAQLSGPRHAVEKASTIINAMVCKSG